MAFKETIVENGIDFVVNLLDRSFKGAKTAVMKFSGTDGTVMMGANSDKPVLCGNAILVVTHAASNGAGAVTVTGARIGDKVAGAANLTTPGDVTSSFESVVTVADQVQQSAATNLSAAQVMFTLIHKTPANS